MRLGSIQSSRNLFSVRQLGLLRCCCYSSRAKVMGRVGNNNWFSVVEFLSPKFPSAEEVIFDGKPSSRCSVQIFSDAEYGGKSSTSFQFDDLGDGASYLRFVGTLAKPEDSRYDANEGDDSFESNASNLKQQPKGSYCALKMDFDRPLDLRDFEGLELIMRTRHDVRMMINVTCESYIDGEICQVVLDLSASRSWKKVSLPFNSFQVTISGHEKDQAMNSDNLRVQSFGILLRSITPDEKDVQFKIDVASLKANLHVDRPTVTLASEFK